eukprot:g14770.t1
MSLGFRKAPSVGRPWLGKRVSNFSSGVMSPRWASWAVTRTETCGKLESGAPPSEKDHRIRLPARLNQSSLQHQKKLKRLQLNYFQ